MLEKIIGKKIELLPKEPKEDQILCEECGGTGWLLKDNKWLENCPHCYGGLKYICPHCGKPYKKTYMGHCDNPECAKKESFERDRKEAEKEQQRFEKAKKVTFNECPAESKEMMYSASYGYDEGYFSDLDVLSEYTESEEFVEMPEYVWATYKVGLSIDADFILENACDELHEDARSNISDEDEKELQEFLDQWCAKQSGTDTYYPDYKLAILLPKEVSE